MSSFAIGSNPSTIHAFVPQQTTKGTAGAGHAPVADTYEPTVERRAETAAKKTRRQSAPVANRTLLHPGRSTSSVAGVLMGAAVLLLATTATAAPVPHSPDLYVSGFFTNDVQRFHGPLSATPGALFSAPGKTGAEYATGVARRPWGMVFGPDGNLFVANQQGGDGAIKRIEGPFGANPGAALPAPGQSNDVFVSAGNYLSVAIGLDQNLYAGSSSGQIQRFDIVNGSALGAFTSGHSPASVGGLALGPDQNLYVASFNSCVLPPNCDGTSGEILRFDGKSGAFLNTFVANGTGGLTQPGGLAFGTNGDLFVANQYVNNGPTGQVLRFHGPLNAAAGTPFPAAGHTGALFAQLPAGLSPFNVAFGPDRTLYVTHDQGVSSFNGRSGTSITPNYASVQNARGLAFYNGAA